MAEQAITQGAIRYDTEEIFIHTSADREQEHF